MKNQTYFTLEYPRGAVRQISKNDNYFEQRVKYDTGYFEGSARSIPAIVCNGATENDLWYVVNLRDASNNIFLQAIAVLGALDRDQAIYAALQTFGAEYPTNNFAYTSESTYFALKRFLDIEQPFYGEIGQDALNRCQAQVLKQPATWADDNRIASHSGSMAALMHDMVQSDVYGELLDPVSKYDAVDMFIGDDGVVETYDALITSYQRLDLLQERLATAMGKAAKGDDITLTGVTRSKPFKRNGVVNVAVIYELSDGQTISVVFHNPDSTPTKLSGQDTLTSWKWLLNKRDVSIVLQPKNGENVQLNQLAIRMLKLAHQNSARFKRTIAKRLENEKTLANMVANQAELKKSEVVLDAEIVDLQKQLDEKTKAVDLDLNGDAELVAAAPIDDNTMTTLMSDLEALGFTKQSGLDGLSNGDVAVSMHYSGEKAVVAVNDKQVLVSKSKSEIISFVKTLVESEETNAGNTPDEPVIEEVAESTPQPIVLTGNELGDFPDTPEGKKELRAAAKSSLEAMLGEWVDCPALNGLEGNGTKVEIRKRGIKEFMAFSGNARKLKLVAAIKDIIKTSTLSSDDGWQINEKLDKKRSAEGYYHLTNSIMVDGEAVNLKVIIEKDNNGLLHYDVLVPKNISKFDSVEIKVSGQPIPDNNSGGDPDNLSRPHDENSVNTFDSANSDDMVLNMFIVGEDDSDFTELMNDPEPAADADTDYLQSIINGTADLAAAGDELERIGENLQPELEDLFEQAAEVYAQYAIAQAATI